MAEHSEMIKAEEHLATRRRAESGSAAEHRAEASYLPTLLRHANLRRRGSSGTGAQALLHLQSTHGNRAVQRQTYGGDGGYEPRLPLNGLGPLTGLYEADRDYKPNPLVPFWASGPIPSLIDYGFYRAGRVDPNAAQPSVPEMVQEHIARVQGTKALIEGEQARKHDGAIDDAQKAITGLPPDWFTGEWKEPRGTLETPQYYDVSPALNPWELDERAREMEMYEAMGMR